MGQAINKLFSLSKRELRSFNIERRTEKIISKDKPNPAPLHPYAVKELERLKEENVSTEYLHKKDEQLDEFLKKVFVTSPDPAPPLERKINPDRPLPVKRTTDYGISYGYSESEEAVVPEGKVSLKQALTFISNHQNDPKKHSCAAIASQYKISLADANDILEHFKMFSVNIGKKEVDPESMSTYERLQHKVKNLTIFTGPDVIREVRAIYGGDKKSADKEKPDEKNLLPDENLVKKEEKSDAGTTLKKDSQNTENLQEENLSLKHEDHTKKETVRKHSQENG